MLILQRQGSQDWPLREVSSSLSSCIMGSNGHDCKQVTDAVISHLSMRPTATCAGLGIAFFVCGSGRLWCNRIKPSAEVRSGSLSCMLTALPKPPCHGIKLSWLSWSTCIGAYQSVNGLGLFHAFHWGGPMRWLIWSSMS